MQINELFKMFIQVYNEKKKNEIWNEQSNYFINQWNKEVQKGLIASEIDDIVKYLDKHGKGNTPKDESIAKVMVPQGAWYKIFKDISSQSELYKHMNLAMFPDSKIDVSKAIDGIFLSNRNNKNNLTGKSGSAISSFLAISNPFNNLSIVSLNDRYKILDFLEIDYIGLKKKNIGVQIIRTNTLIIDFFKENKLSQNARTISVFMYSDAVVKYWKPKKDFTPIILPDIKNDDFGTIIFDEISYINKKNCSEWAITINNNYIRLHFGNFIIFTIQKDLIWLPINKDDSGRLENLKYWKWDMNDYPEYKKGKLFSKNGYFSGSTDNWNNIKEYHYKYIDKIHDKNYRLDTRTRRNHNNRILLLLMEQYQIDLPLPSYVKNDREKIIEIENEIELIDFTRINETECEVIIKNRIGQDIFRENLLRKYGKCLICGIENHHILRASHIKPWSESSNVERLSHNNGLLLCANHDLLFDRFLITFTDEGEMLISEEIKPHAKHISLANDIKIEMNDEMKDFMEWHRDKFVDRNTV